VPDNACFPQAQSGYQICEVPPTYITVFPISCLLKFWGGQWSIH